LPAKQQQNRIVKTAMKLPSALLSIGIAFLGPTVPGNAQTSLTFDDVSTVSYTIMPNGYGGLEWNNFFVQYAPEGLGAFDTGVVSSPNVAFNGLGNPAFFSSPLTLDSAYFTSVYASQDQLTVRGFAGGTQLYDNTYTIYHDTLTLINFDYTGVDSVQFSTSGGTLFTMDNMTITVPEPGTFALTSVALGLGGFGVWRKKIKVSGPTIKTL
jgi:hypothetical protein